MRDVKTARFVIEAEATIADVPVRGADAQLTREGSAKGAIRIDQGGGIVEFQFVIIGQKLWLKGPTGSFQELPLAMASGIYDPSAILDPERGVAKLLSTATEAKTQARESVDGVDAYRVSAKFDPAAVAALVPGAGEGVTGRVWVGVERKLPVRMTFSLPAQGGGKPGTVTVKFSEYDAPVTINAP
jgi:lipoprotein LprG